MIFATRRRHRARIRLRFERLVEVSSSLIIGTGCSGSAELAFEIGRLEGLTVPVLNSEFEALRMCADSSLPLSTVILMVVDRRLVIGTSYTAASSGTRITKVVCLPMGVASPGKVPVEV